MIPKKLQYRRFFSFGCGLWFFAFGLCRPFPARFVFFLYPVSVWTVAVSLHGTRSLFLRSNCVAENSTLYSVLTDCFFMPPAHEKPCFLFFFFPHVFSSEPIKMLLICQIVISSVFKQRNRDLTVSLFTLFFAFGFLASDLRFPASCIKRKNLRESCGLRAVSVSLFFSRSPFL